MTNEDKRLEFHKKLKAIPEVVEAYFQPPANVKMKYDCIRYNRVGGDTNYAGDGVYAFRWAYSVTAISKNPDSAIPDYLAHFPMSSFDRFYTADNLNHWVFTIYY